jgi:hypothetical protein
MREKLEAAFEYSLKVFILFCAQGGRLTYARQKLEHFLFR